MPLVESPGAIPVAAKIGSPSWESEISKAPEAAAISAALAGGESTTRASATAATGDQGEDDEDRQQASHQKSLSAAPDSVAAAVDMTLPARS